MKRINKINLISYKEKNLGFVLVLLIGLISIVVSCQKDFLDITPKDSFTEAAVFNDPALLDAFVNFAYRRTPHGFQEHGGILALAAMGDEAHSKGNVATVGQIIAGNQRPDFLHALDVWTGRGLAINNRDRKSYWDPIKQANEFLYNVKDSELDPDLLKRMTGEMMTLRAYAYFRLISHYGGVPLATEPFSLDNWRVPRNSYDEVMNFVLEELDEAIEMLPLSYSGGNVGKLTKGAAMAIKARALLYYASPLNNSANELSRWQAAADAAKVVIDMGIYELYPDYEAVFLEKTGWHSEIIWARPFHHITEPEVYLERRIFPNSWLGHGHTPPTHNLADAYEMVSGLLPSEDPTYNPQNPYVNRDPRFYATILHDGAPFKGRTLETFIGGLDSFESHISSWNASETGYNLRKFIDEDVDDIGSGNSNPRWIYIRYAEVLLNYAEAMYNLGHEDVARQYVNMVRSRPGVEMPDVTESGEDLWQRIVHERRIELAYEEHRFFDVRRWKIATEVFSINHTRMRITRDPATGVKTYEVLDHLPAQFNEHNYLAPIPLSEIERNGLLEQNPGY